MTETWLRQDITNAEFFDKSYAVYRKDRTFKRGGGVLIALKNDIFSSEKILIPNADKLEYVCIKAITGTHCIFIYSAYIPPNSSADVYLNHLAAIHAIATDPEDVLIIVGDFNLPHVQWAIDDDDILIPTAFDSTHASQFITGLLGMGAHQVNSIRNQNDRLLDLLFTNDFTNVSIDHAEPLTRIDEHHPPILATFDWHEANNGPMSQPTKAFNFKRANYAGMNEHLANVNFTELFQGKALSAKFRILHGVLDGAIKKYVPTVIIKGAAKFPWNNKKLQNLKNRKSKEWKRYKKTRDKRPFDKAFDEFDRLNSITSTNKF